MTANDSNRVYSIDRLDYGCLENHCTSIILILFSLNSIVPMVY